MKYYLIFLIVVFNNLYSYKAKDINDFYNNYYSANYNLSDLQKNNSLTYENISYLAESKKLKDDKEKYNYLKNQIDKNENYLSSNDIDYLISVSELMSYIVYYCGLPEKISFGGKTKDIYKKVLEKDSNNFFALLGVGVGYMHAPKIAGGSDKKAFEYFNKALNNSNQKYQKYLSFVWLSQYYFKIKDNENYKKYIDMSIEIYPNGDLLKEAINRNNNKKKPL
ncbi:hypothetical protein [Brachyspira aalborgi]|uniref:Tetratricopeptide repeat protein n=1 Tax=Brachyspira aalborgi TaxID=29522 RepID=A0A5C8FE14_9SPIR|nr:hypothetical protein [Brachyspira aalborgi]TXJ48246.1 hypothetical protein EPJ84_11065 [Brachyspira aalborgi]